MEQTLEQQATDHDQPYEVPQGSQTSATPLTDDVRKHVSDHIRMDGLVKAFMHMFNEFEIRPGELITLGKIIQSFISTKFCIHETYDLDRKANASYMAWVIDNKNVMAIQRGKMIVKPYDISDVEKFLEESGYKIIPDFKEMVIQELLGALGVKKDEKDPQRRVTILEL